MIEQTHKNMFGSVLCFNGTRMSKSVFQCSAFTFESFLRGGLVSVEKAVGLAGVARAVALL